MNLKILTETITPLAAAEQKKVTDALAELNTKSGGCVSFVQRTNQVLY